MALTKKQTRMIEALHKCLGNITQAAKMTGIHRTLHYKWKDMSPEYAAAVENIDEEVIDYVENQLFRNIENLDRTSIIFFLKCKAKHRGYIDKQIVEVEGDTTFNIKFNGEDDEEDDE